MLKQGSALRSLLIWPSTSSTLAYKGGGNGSIRTLAKVKPNDGVSVDQIISAQPGLIPQMFGFLTNQRLWGVTTFVDHISDFVYVHLMRDLSLAKTLLEKSATEKTMAQAGWTILHYHANNGRFFDNGFVEAINSKDRKITFCGVGAHHQNGVIKKKQNFLRTERARCSNTV